MGGLAALIGAYSLLDGSSPSESRAADTEPSPTTQPASAPQLPETRPPHPKPDESGAVSLEQAKEDFKAIPTSTPS